MKRQNGPKKPKYTPDLQMGDLIGFLNTTVKFFGKDFLSITWWGFGASITCIAVNGLASLSKEIIPTWVNTLFVLVILFGVLLSQKRETKVLSHFKLDTSHLRKRNMQSMSKPRSLLPVKAFFSFILSLNITTIVWILLVLDLSENSSEVPYWYIITSIALLIIVAFGVIPWKLRKVNKRSNLLKLLLYLTVFSVLIYVYRNYVLLEVVSFEKFELMNYLWIYPVLVLTFLFTILGLYKAPFIGYFLQRSRIVNFLAIVSTVISVGLIEETILIVL